MCSSAKAALVMSSVIVEEKRNREWFKPGRMLGEPAPRTFWSFSKLQVFKRGQRAVNNSCSLRLTITLDPIRKTSNFCRSETKCPTQHTPNRPAGKSFEPVSDQAPGEMFFSRDYLGVFGWGKFSNMQYWKRPDRFQRSFGTQSSWFGHPKSWAVKRFTWEWWYVALSNVQCFKRLELAVASA